MRKKFRRSFFIIPFIAFVLLFLLVCYLFVLLHGMFFGNSPTSGTLAESQITFIIDAGHGGEDGGAVGVDGVLEKDLNLIIAKKLKIFLESMGADCVLSRSEDKLLYNPNENYQGHKKILDAKERLRICNSYDNAIFVSIHQNAFPIEKYKGFQIYFSPNNPSSKELASLLESNMRAYLQKDNKRASASSDGKIYLLDKLNCPSVLIECGFLSNKEEANLLSSDAYQNRLCTVISSSLLEFSNKK